MQGYFYSGDAAAASKACPRGDSVAVGRSSRTPFVLFQPTYASQTKVLGVAFGYGRNTTEADISLSPRGTELGRSDSVSGFTFNFKNPDSQYKNGIDSHLDWAASQFLSANWQVGVAGYVYYQLTDDRGSGAKLGPFKSRAASIGPEVGNVFSSGQPANASFPPKRRFQLSLIPPFCRQRQLIQFHTRFPPARVVPIRKRQEALACVGLTR